MANVKILIGKLNRVSGVNKTIDKHIVTYRIRFECHISASLCVCLDR
jgi:hypothetical protein